MLGSQTDKSPVEGCVSEFQWLKHALAASAFISFGGKRSLLGLRRRGGLGEREDEEEEEDEGELAEPFLMTNGQNSCKMAEAGGPFNIPLPFLNDPHRPKKPGG